LVECNDLRLGGTLTGTGITGGTSINSAALEVVDWTGVYGYPGVAGNIAQVSGRPGGIISGDMLGRPRFLDLAIRATRSGPNFTLTAPTTPEQLVDNTDTFLGLLTVPETYLELDMPDSTTRFLSVTALDPFSIAQPKRERTMTVPLIGDWPYWREGGNQQSDTIGGADSVVIGGNADVYDAVMVFAGDGTFTNSTAGWSITITGSAGAVTVDLGNRTVTEGGNPALNRLRRTRRDWGWFNVGSNTVTTSVSTVITWRTQWV